MESQSIARGALLATALLFSTGGAVIKSIPLAGVEIAGLRAGIGAVVLLLLLRPPRSAWTPGAIAVGALQGATLVLFAISNKLATAADGVFLQYTAPLYVLLLSPWLMREPVERNQLVYIFLFAVGALLFFSGPEAAQPTASDPPLGKLVGLASGITWAGALMGLRWLARKHPDRPDAAAAAVIAGNALVFVGCLPWLPAVDLQYVDLSTSAKLAWLGIFQVGVAYAFLERGLRGVSALEASLLLLIEPVLAVCWTWLVHGERQGAASLIGASIILAATISRSLRADR